MNRVRIFFTMIWFCLAFSLAGCKAGDATPTINPTEGAALLAGVYTTTISEEDLADFQSLDPSLPETQGDWRITLFNDGKFDAELNGQWVGSGLMTVTGSELAVYVSSVCEDCPCLQSINRYLWALQDNQLLMAKKAGTCDLMHAVFTTHPLVRQP
jgi:hypothetical protein